MSKLEWTASCMIVLGSSFLWYFSRKDALSFDKFCIIQHLSISSKLVEIELECVLIKVRNSFVYVSLRIFIAAGCIIGVEKNTFTSDVP